MSEHPNAALTRRIFGAFGRDAAEIDKLGEGELVLLEFSDGEGRPVDGERRHDHVDAGAIAKAGRLHDDVY